MSRPEMEFQRFLSALRRADAPTDAQIDSVWSAIVRRANAGDLGPSLEVEEVAVDGGGWAMGLMIGAAAAAIVVTWLAAVTPHGVTLGEGRHHLAAPLSARDGLPPRPTEDHGAIHAPIRGAAPLPALVIETEPPAESAVEPPRVVPSAAAAQARVRRKPRPARADVSDIEAEVSSLARIRRVIADGDLDGAWTQLDEHGARFPSGVLEPERQALIAIVSCRGGPDDDPNARARQYLQDHGDSPLVATVRRACDEHLSDESVVTIPDAPGHK